MVEELSALHKIDTWELIDLPPRKRAIESRWGVSHNQGEMWIEVVYSPKGYIFSQSKYIANILEHARIFDNRAANTHLELNVKYVPSYGVPLPDSTVYRTLVGSLVYLTIIRPDIVYVVHIVSQFVVSPTTLHWAVVLRVLRYL
uniref:Uncharacterized protein LOC113787634 n=1 Tax=Cicer arietinum TaxID=3827 RepID=A0A3Q7XVG5_CICAR|nr:uncharacterized protein LOC113787634 [Cicer arietinum]